MQRFLRRFVERGKESPHESLRQSLWKAFSCGIGRGWWYLRKGSPLSIRVLPHTSGKRGYSSLESCSTVHNRNATVARTLVRRLRTALSARLASVVLAVLLSALPARTQQPNPQQTETPQGHPHATATEPGPCKLRRAGAAMTSAAARQAASAAGATLGPSSESALCLPLMDWYARFLNGPEVKPLTPTRRLSWQRAMSRTPST